MCVNYIIYNVQCAMCNIKLKLWAVFLEDASLRHNAFHLTRDDCWVLICTRAHPDFNNTKVFLGGYCDASYI